VIVTMLARNMQISHADIASNITSFSIPGVDLPAVTERLGSTGGALMVMIDGVVGKQAVMIAYLDNFYLLFWTLLLLAPLPLIAKKPTRLSDP
jgi:DHA2 family multidrug resistance protein